MKKKLKCTMLVMTGIRGQKFSPLIAVLRALRGVVGILNGTWKLMFFCNATSLQLLDNIIAGLLAEQILIQLLLFTLSLDMVLLVLRVHKLFIGLLPLLSLPLFFFLLCLLAFFLELQCTRRIVNPSKEYTVGKQSREAHRRMYYTGSSQYNRTLFRLQ